jgi:hypothetical protein
MFRCPPDATGAIPIGPGRQTIAGLSAHALITGRMGRCSPSLMGGLSAATSRVLALGTHETFYASAR